MPSPKNRKEAQRYKLKSNYWSPILAGHCGLASSRTAASARAALARGSWHTLLRRFSPAEPPRADWEGQRSWEQPRGEGGEKFCPQLQPCPRGRGEAAGPIPPAVKMLALAGGSAGLRKPERGKYRTKRGHCVAETGKMHQQGSAPRHITLSARPPRCLHTERCGSPRRWRCPPWRL